MMNSLAKFDANSWALAKTTPADRKNAKNALKESKRPHIWGEDGCAELLKDYRFLVGYELPEACLFIIKEYLLLPRRNYEAKLEWWNYHYDLPYVTLRKAVFDQNRFNQYKYRTPMPVLPDTQSKAFRQLLASLDAKPLEEEAFCDYSCLRICGTKHCDNEDGLVVRKMVYRFHEMIGVPRVMEQLICGECIENGYDECD
jgi:hypothetical protein